MRFKTIFKWIIAFFSFSKIKFNDFQQPNENDNTNEDEFNHSLRVCNVNFTKLYRQREWFVFTADRAWVSVFVVFIVTYHCYFNCATSFFFFTDFNQRKCLCTVNGWHATQRKSERERLDMHIYWFHVYIYILFYHDTTIDGHLFSNESSCYFSFFSASSFHSYKINSMHWSRWIPFIHNSKVKFLTRHAAIWLWCNCLGNTLAQTTDTIYRFPLKIHNCSSTNGRVSCYCEHISFRAENKRTSNWSHATFCTQQVLKRPVDYLLFFFNVFSWSG